MSGTLEWFATIGGIIAAFMISLDNGRRITGWGFVLFVFASLSWIAYGLMDEETGLMTQNIVLLGINLLGVYRYLIRKRAPEAA
ncbi:YgjV family protein [Allosphingosinicella indica]|uniref:Inner membrane protein n=1 Tax=Allosphingosinicella indica TaxID=941907 RepID=A0A1X7H197_9SPHN|nr:YgjV family protein [Allosphingosinicella indica]SMF78093.1 inner membrane protein [Allosphingosinicella indica]